jgi:hypothetical protein
MKKFLLYITLKWIVFYSYQFLTGDTTWDFEKANFEGIMLSVFMLIALPLLELIILYYPIHFALRQKKWSTIMLLIFAFSLEFLIGWFATNQSFENWMAIKLLLSICLFLIIYRNQLYKKPYAT